VSKIVEGQYVRAKRILTENKDKLTALATKLLEVEVIFKEDLEKIFGDRPFQNPNTLRSNGQDQWARSSCASP
jgi:ATP-dependent Zn protease